MLVLLTVLLVFCIWLFFQGLPLTLLAGGAVAWLLH
jgi:hypothetical protein